MTLNNQQQLPNQQPKPKGNKGDLWEWTKERKYLAYPKWIDEEKQKRAKYPDPRFYVTSVTVKFMTPSGNEEYFKRYMPWKGPISLEFLPWALRQLEDRFMIFLEKTSLMEKAVEEELKDVDLGNIRQFLKRKKLNASTSESE